jgi:hypothetical protein
MNLYAQGGLANSSGRTLETTVVATLASKGFTPVFYRRWLADPVHYGEEILLGHVPYRTIYGHEGRSEFVIRSLRYNLDTRIECKWQQSTGSVDEKFPYLYLNCVESMPEQHIIILVDGGGAKAGSIRWLRDACRSGKYLSTANALKTIEVMNLSDFLIWANKTFR